MKRAVQSPARLKPEAVWAMVSEERRRLLEYLRVLPEEAWDKQSLCRGWKVRHVVAHVILESRYGMLRSLPRWVRHGLSFNRFMYHSALGFGAQGRLELLMALQEDLDKRIAPPLISPLQVLTDLLIHQQDIAIPLGKPVTPPLSTLEYVLTGWRPVLFNPGEWIVGTRVLIRGLKFVATDLEWQYGSGLEVRGRAQDIMLAIAGRSAALDGLEGPGKAVLVERLRP